jgi:hypothetical protein
MDEGGFMVWWDIWGGSWYRDGGVAENDSNREKKNSKAINATVQSKSFEVFSSVPQKLSPAKIRDLQMH